MRSSFLSCALAALALATLVSSARAQELPPSSPSEVELFDYTTVEGDTCAAISERFFGDRRRYDLIHAYNPGMGPPPHDLVPGTVLHLPRRATPASELADATVTGVERRVEARPRPADEAWIAAQRGLGLYRGGRVATQARSAAELTFRDTSVVALREETLVIIFGPSATRTRTAGMEATLETGALRTRLGELRGEASGGNSLRVVTPSGTASLVGGSAVVGVDAQGTSRLSNHSSTARLAGASGPPVTLPTDTGSIVQRGARPSRPRPLPPAPLWQPGATRFAGVAGLGGSLAAAWAPVPAAARYRIEIARQPDGRDVVFATEVPASVTRFEAHRLPPGRYHVTVATLDADLLESRPSTALAMEIVEGRLLAPGEDASSPAPAYDPGDPAVEPAGDIDVLAGSIYAPPAGVRCNDAERVTLTPETSLACTSGSESVMAPAFVVHGIATSVDGTDAAAVTLTRGERGSAVLGPSLDDGVLPADLTLVGSEGIVVEDVRVDAGRFLVVLSARADAAQPAELRWVRESAPSQVIGVVPVTLREPELVARPSAEVEPAPPPEAPRQPRLTEAYARSPVVSALALTDVDRRGSTIGLSVAEIAPAPRAYERTERTRVAIAGDVSLLDDQIQLGTVVPIDVAGRATGTWEAGSLDIYAHARWIPLRRDPSHEDSLALAIDLGAWFPTHPEGLTATDRSGLPLVRLAPSIEVAYAIERVAAFRTRQGALLDLDDTGARLWASAYGVDLNVWGPFEIGVEVDLVLGSEIEASLFAVGIAPQLALELDPVVLGLGMRFGLNRDGQALFGAASVALSGSVAF